MERRRGTRVAAIAIVPERRDWVIVLIGVFKLVKTAILIGLTIALVSRSQFLTRHLEGVAHVLGGAARVRIETLIAKITSTDPKRLKELGIGSAVYALLFAVEGTGLLRRAVWAEYLTIVITTSFIPIEILELVKHGSITKIVVLVLNVAIVGYLIWKLRRDDHWPFHAA